MMADRCEKRIQVVPVFGDNLAFDGADLGNHRIHHPLIWVNRLHRSRVLLGCINMEIENASPGRLIDWGFEDEGDGVLVPEAGTGCP